MSADSTKTRTHARVRFRWNHIRVERIPRVEKQTAARAQNARGFAHCQRSIGEEHPTELTYYSVEYTVAERQVRASARSHEMRLSSGILLRAMSIIASLRSVATMGAAAGQFWASACVTIPVPHASSRIFAAGPTGSRPARSCANGVK